MHNLINWSAVSRYLTGGSEGIRFPKKIPASRLNELDQLFLKDLPLWWRKFRGLDVPREMPEYNEILYHANTCTSDEFRNYWNQIKGGSINLHGKDEDDLWQKAPKGTAIGKNDEYSFSPSKV